MAHVGIYAICKSHLFWVRRATVMFVGNTDISLLSVVLAVFLVYSEEPPPPPPPRSEIFGTHRALRFVSSPGGGINSHTPSSERKTDICED